MNILILIAGILLTALGWWQLDHFVAPIVWQRKGKRIEITTLPFVGDITLEYTQFYVLCYICMFIGWTFTMVWLAF